MRFVNTEMKTPDTKSKGFRPVSERPDENRKLIVTNNIDSRNSYGEMSHAWLVDMIHFERDEVIAFDDADRKIRYITHWRYLSE